MQRLALFGSFSRYEESPDSDCDILVSFRKNTFRTYIGLKDYLEKLLNLKVDLVCEDSIKEIITAIRNARSENKIEPAKKVKAVIYAGDKIEFVRSQEVLIKNLRTGIENLEISASGQKIEKAIYITVGDIEIYLIGALDEEKEKIRIKKEMEDLEKLIKGVKIKLENKEFIDKAPAAVVNKEKEKLFGWEAELKKLKEQI